MLRSLGSIAGFLCADEIVPPTVAPEWSRLEVGFQVLSAVAGILLTQSPQQDKLGSGVQPVAASSFEPFVALNNGLAILGVAIAHLATFPSHEQLFLDVARHYKNHSTTILLIVAQAYTLQNNFSLP